MYTPKECKDHLGWFEIPGYSGYCANRSGEILTKKTGNFTKGGNAGRYLKVKVYRDGADEPHMQYVHILVCLAFKGKCEKGQVVLHKDNQPFNNKPTNLSWGTQSKNVKDGYETGVYISKEDLVNNITISTKDTVKSKSLKIELFHLSFSNKLNGIWEPRNPDGMSAEPGRAGDFPEPIIPRISVSPSIEQCFRAIYPNISSFFEKKKYPHIDMYLYQPKFKGNEDVILPSTITKNKWVWDAHVTEEHWILDKVEMEVIGHYRFYYPDNNDKGLHIKPFDDKKFSETVYVGPSKIRFTRLDKNISLEHLPASANW